MRILVWTAFPPHHERFIDGVSQLEGVVTDGQVVLQPERLQHHAVSDRKRQAQVVAGVTWKENRDGLISLNKDPDPEIKQSRVSPVGGCWVMMLGLVSSGR